VTDWFSEAAKPGASIDPDTVLDGTNLDAIERLMVAGAMVSLSVTRDGGAVRIAVTYEQKTRPEYFRSAEDALPWLTNALRAVGGLPPGASPAAS
jgi:hypothetical protein